MQLARRCSRRHRVQLGGKFCRCRTKVPSSAARPGCVDCQLVPSGRRSRCCCDEVMLASFQTANFASKCVKSNSMLKLLLTLAALIAIAAAVSSDTQGLEFQDLQDSDTDDLLADVSDELDVADELHLDDGVAESSLSSSSHSGNANNNHIAPEPAAPAPNPKLKQTDDDAKTKCTKACCPRGSFGTPGGSCALCPSNHISESTDNGIQNAQCKCPNETSKQCSACNACQHVVDGKCVAKCSGTTKNCKTSGANPGKCY